MATPTDQNDMMKRITATAIAAGPICSNMSIRSRPPPPSVCANAGALISSIVRPAPAIRPNCIFRTSIAPLQKNETDRPAGGRSSYIALLQRELYRDRHDDRHRNAVQQCRGEYPLTHCVECRLIEQRDRAQYLCVFHRAVGADGRLDDHDALHARGLRDRRVDGTNVARLLRRLDVAADAHRRRRWRRGRRRFGNAAGDAAGNAADDAAFDTSRALEAGFETGLGFDLFRRFERRRIGADVHRRGRSLRLGRWWWRWRRRWRWWSRYERHHRGRRRHHAGRHQRDDHQSCDDRRLKQHGEWHRVPHLVAHLDRRIDDITEHVAWHYSSSTAHPSTPLGIALSNVERANKDRRLLPRRTERASVLGSLRTDPSTGTKSSTKGGLVFQLDTGIAALLPAIHALQVS